MRPITVASSRDVHAQCHVRRDIALSNKPIILHTLSSSPTSFVPSIARTAGRGYLCVFAAKKSLATGTQTFLPPASNIPAIFVTATFLFIRTSQFQNLLSVLYC